MVDYPSGTVTFLFTDIAGSTRLWEDHPEAMRTAVDRHFAILRQAIADHGGVLFKTVGDAVQAAFPNATAGLAAAIAAQRALAAEPWPAPLESLPVRVALHAGTATPSDGDYLAPSLNRLSRLMLASHGGQVVLSETVRRLLEGNVPAEASLKDLGEHRLRDLLEPERVWQVVAPGLETEFPPLGTLAARPHNLPAQPPLIGREAEVAAILERFREGARLVTITGPGGTGKTRLALESAAELMDDFPDGVWFLDLSGLTDPTLALPQVAVTLGVRESGELPAARAVAGYLAGKRVLLVLDNLEQFRPFAALSQLLADLLAAVPELAILATSRAPLRVRLEQEFPLSPLPVPAADDATIDALLGSPAVRLFVARAQAARPGFVLGPRNAAAVAAICRRLDGLPLAIELAAARVRALTPADILIRLGDRIDLLADPRSDRPDRQRTLEATVAWSHDLLDPRERAAFRQMAVFAGGCTFEAAEAVLATGTEPGIDPLDLVTALVEQGLLRDEEQPDGTLRFRMLEPVRLYALERLRECGEEEAARLAHGEYFCHFVLSTSQNVESGLHETVWLDRIGSEHDNVRAALDWLLRTNSSGALALAVTLWRFWWARGFWAEAKTWIERSLAQVSATPTTERATALRALGLIADATGDHQRGLSLLEQSLELARTLDDGHGEWQTLLDLSLVWAARDYGEASRYAEQALALARELNDPPRIARSLNRLGNCQLNREMPREAIALHRDALGILERLGDEQGIAETLDLLGIASVLGADPQGTVHWFTRAVDAWRAIGDQRGLASSLMGLTMAGPNFHTDFAALPAEAVRSAGEESLALCREIGWRAGEAFALWGFRGMGLGATGDYATALRSAREALVIAQEIEHQQWETGACCALGHLYADLCDWEAAKAAYMSACELAREVESLYWTRSAAGWLAATYVQAGWMDEAASILEDSWNDTIPIDTIAGRLLWTAAADLALAQGNLAEVLQIADRLATVAGAPANRAIPRLEILRGQALSALERYSEAERALEVAHQEATWSGMRPQLWRVHAARALLHAAQNQPREAEQALAAAQSVVEELAVSVPDDALRALFVERAVPGSVSLRNAS